MSDEHAQSIGEYSYFRAGGVTSDAIDLVIKARADMESLRHELAQRFNAYNMFFENVDGACRIICFGYNDQRDIPKGWEKVPYGQVTFRCMPPEGSADHFTLLSYQGRLTRALRRTDLGFFLDVPPLPVKAMPAGYYSQRFVRKETYVSEFRAYIGPRPEPQDHGNYKEDGDSLPNDTKQVRYQQAIKFLKYDGVHYVRVPNDAQGQPVWIPPDSAPVSYGEMLALDNALYRRQYGANAARSRFGV